LIRQRGFGLLEMMVTVAIMAWLAASVIPSMLGTMQTSKARGLVGRFAQDFAWARGQAVTGSHSVTLTFNSDCSWSIVQDAVQVSEHSYTTAQVTSAANGISCSTSSAFPLALSFNAQGFVSTTGTLTFTAVSGQTFPLQILLSGALIRASGAA
jgi:prepilin-type N-terminal cleavage/methylation domain-containing protein